MPSVEQELTEIRRSRDAAERDRARAEAQIEAHKGIIREESAKLQELGCDSLEEARKKVREIQDRMDVALEEIRQTL